MEEQILELLSKKHKALSIKEIQNLLSLKTPEEFRECIKTLNKLEDELKVYRSNKDNFMLFENDNIKLGVLLATKKNYAFVDIEGKDDVFIPPNCLNGAIHKDKVVVEITSKKGTELEGRIVKIVDRKLKNMVGEVKTIDGKKQVVLDNEKVKLTLILSENNLGAMDGHKVYVKIKEKIGVNTYLVDVLKILGHKQDPGVDILSIVYKYDIPDAFSDEVREELNNIPDSLTEEEINKRLSCEYAKDLRDEVIFTIDGDDTKDIDDAISIEKLENGNYKLGVHIADVSYYVKEKTKLNEEAYLRGTSVYLADRVIPMIPHKLSNGICSLNENEDRFAISCVMEIDEKGNVVNYDIFESIIRSRIQMTYDKVNKLLEENEIVKGYEKYADKLRLMKDLADILRKNKENRGYIDFEINESKIIVDDQGEAIDVVLRKRGAGEKLIEDFMIVANETVASAIYYMQLPFLYRVHGTPSEEKITRFISFVSSLGYKINGNFKEIKPTDMQKILSQLKDKKEYSILSTLLLRSMQKAIYDKNNIGHFGLGSKCYTHFTSPIRRYPDTTVHRLIRKYLFEHNYDETVLESIDENLIYIGEHTSERERAAADCEREVDDMKKAEYMQKHIGEVYSGIISSITSFGIFVELPNLVEGLIRIEDLKDDYYEYDESTITLRGKQNKRGYRLGDNVDVVVLAANKEAKTIDFLLATKENIDYINGLKKRNEKISNKKKRIGKEK